MNATIDRQRLNAIEQRRAKDAAQLAFIAYETAVRNDDASNAEAARARFLSASAAMSAQNWRLQCGG